MSEIVTAVHENGVLRLMSPVTLHEGQKVRILVLPELPEPTSELERVLQPLIDAGKLTPSPLRGTVEPVSEAARRQRTERLKVYSGKPLSEIIIEDRGQL